MPAKPKTSSTAPEFEDVVFDLDAEKRSPDQIREPFTTRVGGRKITMIDPEEIHWQDLNRIQKPTDFIGFALTPSDREHLYDQDDMPGWKLGRLMEAYMAHYNLEERLEKMQRANAREQGLRSV